MIHWELEHEPTDATLLRYCPQARSTNIETTAYVLLIHAVATDVTAGLDIIKWLVRQRNGNGGFGSTQVREDFLLSKRRPLNQPVLLQQ